VLTKSLVNWIKLVGHHHRAIQSYSQNVNSIYEGQKTKGLSWACLLLFTIFFTKGIIIIIIIIIILTPQRHEIHEGPKRPKNNNNNNKIKKASLLLELIFVPNSCTKEYWNNMARVSWVQVVNEAHTLELQWRMHTNQIHAILLMNLLISFHNWFFFKNLKHMLKKRRMCFFFKKNINFQFELLKHNKYYGPSFWKSKPSFEVQLCVPLK